MPPPKTHLLPKIYKEVCYGQCWQKLCCLVYEEGCSPKGWVLQHQRDLSSPVLQCLDGRMYFIYTSFFCANLSTDFIKQDKVLKGGMQFIFQLLCQKWFFENHTWRSQCVGHTTIGIPGCKLIPCKSFSLFIGNTIHLKVGSLVSLRSSTFLFHLWTVIITTLG